MQSAEGGPKTVRLVTGEPVPDERYEAGYRDGRSSLVADIRFRFTEFTDTTMDDLLDYFRMITGDPELEWPEA